MIALGCGLSEETKWGKPCFTYQEKNVAIVIPLKEACAFSFVKGALLGDPKHILQKIGEHTQSGRWIKFTSVKEIAALESTLRNYISDAIKVQKSGKKVALKKASEYSMPEELQAKLNLGAKAYGRHSRRSRPGRQEMLPATHRKSEAAEDAACAGGKVCSDDTRWQRLLRLNRARAPLPPGLPLLLLAARRVAAFLRLAALVGAIRLRLHAARRLIAGLAIGVRTLRLIGSLSRAR